MEIELIQSKVDLGKMVWIPQQYRDLASSTNPLTRNTFRIWDGLCRLYHWEYNAQISRIDTNYFKPEKENQ